MIVEWLLNNLWAAFVLLIGYIIKQRDSIIKGLETTVANHGTMISEQHTQLEVYREKLDGVERVMLTKLENLEQGLSEIKTILRAGGKHDD